MAEVQSSDEQEYFRVAAQPSPSRRAAGRRPSLCAAASPLSRGFSFLFDRACRENLAVAYYVNYLAVQGQNRKFKKRTTTVVFQYYIVKILCLHNTVLYFMLT